MKISRTLCAVTAGLLLEVGVACAAPVVTTGEFYFRENRGVNGVGLQMGDRLIYGANTVVPNGNSGTTATRAFGGGGTANLPFNPRTTTPNQFSGSADYTPARALLPVNMVFRNGPDSTPVSVAAIGDVALMPLAFNLGVAGAGTNLVFSWNLPVIPAGLTLDRSQFIVYDREDFNVAANANMLFAAELPSPTATSFVLPMAFSQGLILGHSYTFGIRLENLRASAIPEAGAPARRSSSQAFFDFVPTAAIPIPGSHALMLAGLLIVCSFARRKTRPGK